MVLAQKFVGVGHATTEPAAPNPHLYSRFIKLKNQFADPIGGVIGLSERFASIQGLGPI